jgi:hypothetical protein
MDPIERATPAPPIPIDLEPSGWNSRANAACTIRKITAHTKAKNLIIEQSPLS